MGRQSPGGTVLHSDIVSGSAYGDKREARECSSLHKGLSLQRIRPHFPVSSLLSLVLPLYLSCVRVTQRIQCAQCLDNDPSVSGSLYPVSTGYEPVQRS